ncbi:MAG TPA: hypothetical protein VJ418_10305 [Streptosporangiaceae bacterium]|nr:hypothetical protein [Streptosporangiaceae bacterium]
MEQSSDGPEEARCGYCFVDVRRAPGQAWIYIAGPLAGAMLAVALAWAVRGPPPPAIARGRPGRPGHRHLPGRRT